MQEPPSENLTRQDKKDIKGIIKTAVIMAGGGTALGLGVGTAIELLTNTPPGTASVPLALIGFGTGGLFGPAIEGLGRIRK